MPFNATIATASRMMGAISTNSCKFSIVTHNFSFDVFKSDLITFQQYGLFQI